MPAAIIFPFPTQGKAGMGSNQKIIIAWIPVLKKKASVEA